MKARTSISCSGILLGVLGLVSCSSAPGNNEAQTFRTSSSEPQSKSLSFGQVQLDAVPLVMSSVSIPIADNAVAPADEDLLSKWAKCIENADKKRDDAKRSLAANAATELTATILTVIELHPGIDIAGYLGRCSREDTQLAILAELTGIHLDRISAKGLRDVSCPAFGIKANQEEVGTPDEEHLRLSLFDLIEKARADYRLQYAGELHVIETINQSDVAVCDALHQPVDAPAGAATLENSPSVASMPSEKTAVVAD